MFVFVGLTSNSVQAQPYGSEYLSYLMLSDWQIDYFTPIEPDELETGEFRFYGNAANVSYLNQYFMGNSKGSVMNYLMGFDTAVRDDLYLHLNYSISPWQAESDNDLDEDQYQLLNMFLDYELNNSTKVYFGYNYNERASKNYNESAEEFEDVQLDYERIIFVGVEYRGSFLK